MQQAPDVDGRKHGVYVNTATIRWKWRQSEARKVICVKLVQEIRNFFREEANLTVLAEPHLVGADHLLPSQRTPSEVVFPASSQVVGDLTPPQGPGPDIAADAKAAALVRVLLPFGTQIGPPPISWQRGSFGSAVKAHPVVVLKAWIVVVDTCCTNTSNLICYELLRFIITCCYVL